MAAFRQELVRTGNEEQRKVLVSALKRLSKGKVPDAMPGYALESFRQRFSSAMACVADAKERLRQEFETAAVQLSEEIRKVASDPLFREAVLLQNSRAASRVMRALARESVVTGKRGFKERQNEELIANYLQRYCVKNDTIGFFGPVGWAHFEPETQGMSMRPGPGLVSSSTIYFENWCIEALAENIARNEKILPWLAPRLLPYFWIDGDTLRLPGGGRFTLSPIQLAILRECSGEKTAREIAIDVLAAANCELADENQVYEVLKHLKSRRIVSWTLEIPFDIHPEWWLRRLLQRIEDESLQCEAIGFLDELEQARQNVSRSLGSPDLLEQALDELNSTFTRITGRDASRSPGQMYASRTLIYEDCQRSVDLKIGADLASSLATPLSIVLDSARWFSAELATLVRDAFQRIHADLKAKTGKEVIDLLQFWTVSESLLLDPKKRLANSLIPELQRRWTQILGEIPTEKHVVKYRSQDLKASAEEVFAAPRAGWQLARYHSPDVMIAASDTEAINRGDYSFVLGEVHVTSNTLRYAFMMSQHSHPQELVEAFSRDMVSPKVVPVLSRQWPRITNRTSLAVYSPQDYHLEISPQLSNCPRSCVIPISNFVVENSEDGLIVRTLDGRLKFDVVDFFGEILSFTTAHAMEFIGGGNHIPRLVVDQLVISRESWSFQAVDLKFIDEKNEHERFLEVRRWMRKHGLPRFAFAKFPVETKPIYVDFDSLIYVEMLTKMIRRTLASDRAHEPITVTEMLPRPDELWLRDHEGHQYTSELRIVAHDLKGQGANETLYQTELCTD
ncbi:MAG TPA: lantibiotic dehydratase [Terriglobales bacterium]